jgi:hypothetical protein
MRDPRNVPGTDKGKPLLVVHLEGSGFVSQPLRNVALTFTAGPPMRGRLHAFGSDGTRARITVHLDTTFSEEKAPRKIEETDPTPDTLTFSLDTPPADAIDPINVDLVSADPCSSPE